MSRRTNQVVAPGCGGVPAPPQVHFGKSDVQITSIGSVGTMIIIMVSSTEQSIFDISAANGFCNVCQEGQTGSLPPDVEVFRHSPRSTLASLMRRSRLSGL